MNFEIIPIDNYKSGKTGRSGSPNITFGHAGAISLTNTAVRKILPSCLDDESDVYLHILTSDNNLYVRNLDGANGLKIRFDEKGVARRDTYKIVGQSTGLVRFLTSKMDWPLAKDKKRSIRYTIGDEAAPGIFALN